MAYTALVKQVYKQNTYRRNMQSCILWLLPLPLSFSLQLCESLDLEAEGTRTRSWERNRGSYTSTDHTSFLHLQNLVTMRYEILKPLRYLAQVDKHGAQRPVHPITAVARVRLPHILHPLSNEQTTNNTNINVRYSRARLLFYLPLLPLFVKLKEVK